MDIRKTERQNVVEKRNLIRGFSGCSSLRKESNSLCHQESPNKIGHKNDADESNARGKQLDGEVICLQMFFSSCM